MSLGDLLPQTASHRRLSSSLLVQTTWPFTTAVSWSTPTAGRLKLNGSTLSGGVTVTITGTLNGNPQSETITVPGTAPQIALSTNRWSTVTQIASADVVSGALLVDGIEQTGKPIFQESVLDAALKIRFLNRALKQVQTEPGTELAEQWVIYSIKDGFLPRDILVVGTIRYNVDNVIRQYDATAFHHSELLCSRQPA